MTTQNWQEPATFGTGNLAVQQGEAAGSSSTAAAAKDEAKDVAREGAGAARQVAGTAAAEARNVAQEAGTQAKNLAAQLGTDLKNQAGAQQQKVAEGLRSISDELHSMAQNAQGSGAAGGLVGQAAQRTADVASWLEARDPGSLLTEVKDFARRRPGAFLAIAAGAGLLAGRLTRGIAGVQSGTQPGPAAPAAPAYVPPVPQPAAETGVPAAAVVGRADTTTTAGGPSEAWDEESVLAPGTLPQSTAYDERLPRS